VIKEVHYLKPKEQFQNDCTVSGALCHLQKLKSVAGVFVISGVLNSSNQWLC